MLLHIHITAIIFIPHLPLCSITGIERSEVEKIVAKLKKENFIEEKRRGGFTGWVSKGDLESLTEIDLDDEEIEG
jgi:hypothetical protein